MKTIAELDPRQKPLSPLVSQYLDDSEARAVERVLKSRIVCIKQPGYRRDREEKYRFDRKLFNGSTSGLGKHEASAFHWMNFCLFRLIQTILKSRNRTLGIQIAREIAKWSMEADATRNGIVIANERLAYKAAQRTKPHHTCQDEWNQESMMILLRIIGAYDVARGLRFSTLAYRSIIRGLVQKRRQVRFLKLYPLEGQVDEYEPDVLSLLIEQGDNQAAMNLIADLNVRDRDVIWSRFGIGQKKETLKEIALRLGVSHETVRQIEKSIIVKIWAAIG